MVYFIVLIALGFIFFRMYKEAVEHDKRFAVIEDEKLKSLIAEMRRNVDSPDLKNKVKTFLNELEASTLSHKESVELMLKRKD